MSDPPFDTLNLGRSTEDRPEAVAENRRRFLESLSLAPARLATAGQVHGAAASLVDRPGLAPECDALVTREPDLALAITAADCLPILYVAPEAVAAAHAGWRGSVAGIAVRALDLLCEAGGIDPAAVRVHFGPCIRSCCYVVGPEVAARFPSTVVRGSPGDLRLDLVAHARQRLEEAGVPRESFEDCGACTACDPSLYFSHRRDRGRTGRHWGVVARLRGA